MSVLVFLASGILYDGAVPLFSYESIAFLRLELFFQWECLFFWFQAFVDLWQQQAAACNFFLPFGARTQSAQFGTHAWHLSVFVFAGTATYLRLLHGRRPGPPKIQTPKSKRPGFLILDLGFWIFILDLGFWIGLVSVLFVAAPNAAVWILDLGFWIVVVSVLVVAAPNAAVWILDFGFCKRFGFCMRLLLLHADSARRIAGFWIIPSSAMFCPTLQADADPLPQKEDPSSPLPRVASTCVFLLPWRI